MPERDFCSHAKTQNLAWILRRYFSLLLLLLTVKMTRFGTAMRRLPPAAAIQVLRKGFVLPAPAARLFFKDILRPEKWHRKWIRKVR